jgi:hypothetical protein
MYTYVQKLALCVGELLYIGAEDVVRQASEDIRLRESMPADEKN